MSSAVNAVLKSRTFSKLCVLGPLGILLKASFSPWTHSHTTQSSVSSHSSPFILTHPYEEAPASSQSGFMGVHIFFFLLCFGHLSVLLCGNLKGFNFKTKAYFRTLVCLSLFRIMTAALCGPLTPCVPGQVVDLSLSPSRLQQANDSTSHIGLEGAEGALGNNPRIVKLWIS